MELLDRFFDRLINDWQNNSAFYPSWTPPVDIYETDDAFIVEAELPGVHEEDIEIKVEDDVLFLSGVRKTVRECQKCHRLEREQGYFSRRFKLSTGTFATETVIDKNHIRASLNDGILTIILPKKEEYITRHIEIEGQS
jgi:HSP20 family protein